MKAFKLTCVIFFSLITLVACNQRPENTEEILEYDLSSTSLTSTEKKQAAEEQLIDRLQTIINKFSSVSDAVISITTSEEIGKEVHVSITTEESKQLTSEQKNAITDIIAASVGDVEADSIHIAEN